MEKPNIASFTCIQISNSTSPGGHVKTLVFLKSCREDFVNSNRNIGCVLTFLSFGKTWSKNDEGLKNGHSEISRLNKCLTSSNARVIWVLIEFFHFSILRLDFGQSIYKKHHCVNIISGCSSSARVHLWSSLSNNSLKTNRCWTE